MANYQSAIRRIRTSERARQRNRHYRTEMRTAIKRVLSATNKEDAQKQYINTTALLDKMAAKGIIHKNKAANKKSRLAHFVNNLQN